MSLITVKKTKEGRIALLELNLPEKRNILSLDMIQALTSHLDTLKQDPDLHLMILSGKGGHFCAGGDLRWMSLNADSSDLENINQVKLLAKMLYTLSSFPLPVIGKIQGSVFGGGLGLAALCDIAVAHKDSQFCFSELKLALVPALIAPFVLKKMPLSNVKELMLSARVFKAEEAKKLALVHFFGDAKECDDYIKKLSEQLLSYDKTALKQTKKLIGALAELSEAEAKEYTAQALAERRKSPEASKKISRFLKSRQNKSSKQTNKA